MLSRNSIAKSSSNSLSRLHIECIILILVIFLAYDSSGMFTVSASGRMADCSNAFVERFEPRKKVQKTFRKRSSSKFQGPAARNHCARGWQNGTSVSAVNSSLQ